MMLAARLPLGLAALLALSTAAVAQTEAAVLLCTPEATTAIGVVAAEAQPARTAAGSYLLSLVSDPAAAGPLLYTFGDPALTDSTIACTRDVTDAGPSDWIFCGDRVDGVTINLATLTYVRFDTGVFFAGYDATLEVGRCEPVPELTT